MPRARGRGGAGRGRAAEGPLGPADARELFERAKRLTAAQSYSDARRILDRLARHAPDETAVRLLRARVFMVGHRDVARARDDLEHVLAGRPQHVGAAVSYARLLVMSGDLAGAEARARALFAQAPDAPEALNLLSEIAPAAVRAEDAERFEKRLAAGEIGAGAALAHHALGRIWDARGAIDRAFAHVKAGNDAAYAARPQPYRADLEQARFEHVRDGITAEMMAEKAGFGVKSGRPIFIVGMPRCGSTLLEHALAAHPKLDAAGECNVLHRVEQELWARGGRAPQAFDRVALLAGLGKGDAQLGGAAYLEQTRFFLRKNHVGPFVDKTLPNYTRLPLIFSIFRD
ncbi:MAG: sulfotransferase, partial [Pseudomonadota bacterium]